MVSILPEKYSTFPRRQKLCHLVLILTIVFLLPGLLTSCVKPQIHSSEQHKSISLEEGELESHGVSFITPSTKTGQEEDKQALAQAFANILIQDRPDVRCVTLPETLSLINQAGMAEEYKNMFEEYQDTGIFKREILKQVGNVTGTRYVAQLKLAGFHQGTMGRFGAFGFDIVKTRYANLRIFFQIWDSEKGTIAWEGGHEINYASDTAFERNITFKRIVEEAAQKIVARLP